MHQSILSYKGSRYLWVSLMLCTGAIFAYALDEPSMPANGGTALGYTLGTIAALQILLLMWFGIRKRRYKSKMGTVVGWLSAHVYIGLSLVIVATLHTGFQFGWNVHTFAYVLMVVVIVSGIYGVYCYLHFPTLMTNNREESSPDSLLRQIHEIDRKALAMASEIDSDTHEKILKSIRRTRVGGSVLAIIFGRHKKNNLDSLAKKIKVDSGNEKKEEPDTNSTMMFMAKNISTGSFDSNEKLRELMDLIIGQKEKLLSQLRQDLQYKAYMDMWLYIHVPLSFALLAALAIHIFSVFFYW